MNLSSYDILYMGKKAKELGFIRDTLEKVTRLADILEYFNTNPLLKDSLALKGGTAINLTIFNLPRLSVDIDLDYIKLDSKDVMLENRKAINSVIDRYMTSQGYTKSLKTKTPHSLDSWVYEYINLIGNKDNIKIEINYSLRAHVLPVEERPIVTQHFSSEYKVKSLAAIEIFGSKINALLSRAAARDLYDVGNMIKFGLFDESEEVLLRKCVVFYAAISAKKINKTFDTKAIDSISKYKIKTDLLPVIRRKDQFDLDIVKKVVKQFIKDLMVLTNSEGEFLEQFENNKYVPELLFEHSDVLCRIKNHPMALWKTR
ncbi:nucleotidyl transferase AbiEii/AbiGii toxin family protein [Mycoplasmatota bacterium]|nr:nucleotidyl transferase AbiEii/AbiGii toxin family protein [Mycoplasmatota bacterium]